MWVECMIYHHTGCSCDLYKLVYACMNLTEIDLKRLTIEIYKCIHACIFSGASDSPPKTSIIDWCNNY
jgi:hypothetical protein